MSDAPKYDIDVPLLGINGEYHHPDTNTYTIPCKAGYIRVYHNDTVDIFSAHFPTPLLPGIYAHFTENILDIKLIVLDYLSKEAGRSETKEVPLPSEVSDG